jgi:hypothetical protein
VSPNGNLPASVDIDLHAASTDDVKALRDRIVERAGAEARAGDADSARQTLAGLEFATIDDKTLRQTDPLLDLFANGRRVVASLDPKRRPRRNEVVVIYGNYPLGYANIVVNNPIRRHAADFWRLKHDAVESDRRWQRIDRILIINADGRADRWDSVLRELATARAPFDRITRVAATTPPADVSGEAARHLACLHSHVEALRISQRAGFETTLILEDDFTFTSDIDVHLDDLSTFLGRRYDYWVCLLGTSKYGAVVPLDDLVARSFQQFTNAEAYLTSAAGRDRLITLFEESAQKLAETGDAASYAADRCWAALQPSGKFLVFRRKFGFQAASYSDIYGSISRYLD